MKKGLAFQFLFTFVSLVFLLLPYLSVSAVACTLNSQCAVDEFCDLPNPPLTGPGVCRSIVTGETGPAPGETGPLQGETGPTAGETGPTVIGGGKQELINPLTGKEGNVPFTTIINQVITALAGLAAVFALLGFVWGGVTWITAYGSEQKITRGKQMLTWSFVGLIVVFGAYGFVRFIIEQLIGQK